MKDFNLKKLYYSISEVSKLTDLEQYILRYWETEFDQLKPSKNRAGNRIYTAKDIQTILLIKKLLREEKYTIDGAKKIIETGQEEQEDLFNTKTDMKLSSPKNSHDEKIVRDLHSDLLEIKNFLIDLKSKIL